MVPTRSSPFAPFLNIRSGIADVALFTLVAWKQTPDDDYFRGVPALVIEVLSPSNSASEMLEREELCLSHGGQEFWLVDPQRETVKVIRSGGHSSVLHLTDHIESGLLRSAIPVRDVFQF